MANQKLIAFLEMLGPQQASGCLTTWKPETQEVGYIFLHHGKVVYSQAGSLSGISSALMTLSWDYAEVDFDRDQNAPKMNCNHKTDLILYEFIQLENQFGSEADLSKHLHSEVDRKKKRMTLHLPDLQKYALYLEVDHPDFSPVIYEVVEGSHVLGTSQESDFQLQSPTVSKAHCRLELVDNMLSVYDLGSTNGTYVQGNIVDSEYLFPGDELRLGDLALQVKGALRRKLIRDTATVAVPKNPKLLQSKPKLPQAEVPEETLNPFDDNTRPIHWKDLKPKAKNKGLLGMLKKK